MSKTRNKFSPEVRDRAVRMVGEHRADYGAARNDDVVHRRHREDLGIEPICRELAIAPSSYHEHAQRLADPGRRPARARRDDEIMEQIKRVHEASSGLYGARKVWRQLLRDGVAVARCTVERLMAA